MGKRILFVLAVLVMLISFSACSSQQANIPTISEAETTSANDNPNNDSTLIEISNFSLLPSDGSSYAHIEFTVKNVSDMQLTLITLNISFLDSDGTIIHTTHPQESARVQPSQSIKIKGLYDASELNVSAVYVDSYDCYEYNTNNYFRRYVEDPVVYEIKEDSGSVSNTIATEIDSSQTTIDCFLSDCDNEASLGIRTLKSNHINYLCQEHLGTYISLTETVGSSWEYVEMPTCLDCTQTATKVFFNQTTGKKEYYCYEHYKFVGNSGGNSSSRCVECVANATKTYINPFSGTKEYYCDIHYTQIVDMMSKFESDVAVSDSSKKKCEECNREGTHTFHSFLGITEYYCTEHYEELKEIAAMLKNN